MGYQLSIDKILKSKLPIHGKDSTLAIALGRDFKGKISIAVYAIAVPLAFVNSLVAFMLHVLIAIIWLIPDRRIEKAIDP
jgi:hypothetical protein